jgi:hypothetical protein
MGLKLGKNIFRILLMLIFLVSCTFSQDDELYYPDFKKVAQAGFKFLSIGVGARQTAMGDAAVTEMGDASALFWNPAGIAAIDRVSVFVDHTSWLIDTNLSSAAAVLPLGQYGNLGISALMMDYGTIQGTRISNNNIGYEDTETLEPGSYSIGLTYGRRLTERFQFALTSKFAAEDLVAMDLNALAFDFGTIFYTGAHGMHIGFTIQNFVFKELHYINEEFMLPLTFRVGFSADVTSLAGISSDHSKVNLVLEGAKPRDFSERVHAGLEYKYGSLIALRGGYRFNYDEGGLTFGVGLGIKTFDVGFSYADFGSMLGNVSRISANFAF